MTVPDFPGRPGDTAQRGEFEAAREWVQSAYEPEGERNPIYDRLFNPAGVTWTSTSVLDVGAGPVSIFEHVAPPTADVIAYDSLAAEYNGLVPHKKFPITATIPDRAFDLVAILNCLDHMDDPDELLAHVVPYLHDRGTAWIYCNIDQPYDPRLHPQDFRFWQIIALVGRHLDIDRCGLVREGHLFPYAWWAICRPRRRRPATRLFRHARFNVVCAAQYTWFYAVRAAVKAVKILGGRPLLPKELRF